MKVHHIGIIVKDIEKSILLYQKLDYRKTSDIVTDTVQNNKIAFLQSGGGLQKIELIEPLDETSSIYRFKEGYHHICYEMEPEEDVFLKFNNVGVMGIGKIFTKPIKAPALGDREVVFACLRNGVFVEFILWGGSRQQG